MIFKKLLHLTGCSKNNALTLEIFRLGGQSEISKSQVRRWRDTTDSKRWQKMPDWALTAFFDGLFAYRDQNENVLVALKDDSSRSEDV